MGQAGPQLHAHLQSGEFGDEMILFIEFVKSRACQKMSSLPMLLEKEHLQSTFPNVEIAIHMYTSLWCPTVQANDHLAKWH
jgi:hypothetical protein